MGLFFLYKIGRIILALTGVVGAVLALLTRDDAFDAADRQSKWIWAGMLMIAAALVVYQLPFLTWIGIVIIGLYWFDVRPQIKDILNGRYDW
ncbi:MULTISPECIES: DUF2516 family protein [unclassified Corynebacterium]|uniref:DUF2516 family protein n=1 Tax=unclassified Corynebacterium TaxID=2624378 RepID=UPI001FEDEB1A|nr:MULTISPECIES: DUF2516 family protein [unclassified Corynebacterium]